MDKLYKIIITTPHGDIIAAFTTMGAMETKLHKTGVTYETRLNEVYKEWDITETTGYPAEWIKTDYHIDNFDLIMHD